MSWGARCLMLLGLAMLLGLLGCDGGRGGGQGPAEIRLVYESNTLAKGRTMQVRARAFYRDGSSEDVTESLQWTSSDPGVATVDDAEGTRGALRAMTQGSCVITARQPSGAVQGSAPLLVLPEVLESVAVTPSAASIALGTTQQLAATGTYSDSTTRDLTSSVDWQSAAPAIASVSAPGLFSGDGIGAVTVTATDVASGVSGATTLTVTSAVLVSLAVTPVTPSIALGTTQQFTATGTYSDATTQDLTSSVVWSSSSPGVATLDLAGLATSSALGTTTVLATDASSGVQDAATLTVTSAVLVSLAVTPVTPSIALGTTRQFTATGTYSDATTQDLTTSVTWSSSSPSVATVSNAGGSEGLASSAAQGVTTIAAIDPGSGVNDATTLTVTSAVLVSLAVTPAAPSIALGTTRQFTATGTYSDATTQDLTTTVTWSSSSPSVATVSNAGGSEGLASSASQGATTITATYAGSGVNDATTLTVTSAVLVSLAVTPVTPSIALGTTRQFTATGTYSDATAQDLTTTVTWSSSSPSVATVSNAGGSEGLASSSALGVTTIAAIDPGSGVNDATTLTVTSAVLVSLAVTPVTPSIALGTTRQFTATGTYSDATTQDLTTTVTWSSSSPSVATVSNAGGSEGLASSASQGATTITATHAGSGVNDATTLTVTAPVLVSLAVTPPTPSVVLGSDQQFAATGTYSDGSTADLTTTVTWVSSSPAVATIGNSGGSEGLANSLSVGVTTVSATDPGSGVSDTASLAVVADITMRASSSAAQPSGVLAVAVATPSGTLAGDVMVATIAVRPMTAVITPPAGWTLVRRQDSPSGVAHSLVVYRRVAATSEPASHTWSLDTSTGAAAGIVSFAGVDTTDPVDVDDGQATVSGLSHAAPSVTTTVARTMLLTAHCFASSADWTPPAGMVEVVDVFSEAAPSSVGISLSCNYELQAAAGATGARTATAAADDDVGAGIAVALKPTP